VWELNPNPGQDYPLDEGGYNAHVVALTKKMRDGVSQAKMGNAIMDI